MHAVVGGAHEHAQLPDVHNVTGKVNVTLPWNLPTRACAYAVSFLSAQSPRSLLNDRELTKHGCSFGKNEAKVMYNVVNYFCDKLT